LWEMIHYERLKAPYNKHGVYIDHNLFELNAASSEDEPVILAQLNSTFFGIVRELYGRSNLGEGSLKTEGTDIAKFPIFAPYKISKDLLGWRLYSGTKYIECRTGEEARYLKIFLEVELQSVKIPENHDYLKNIIGELEELKIHIDDIIKPYLDSIINNKVRDRLKHELWSRLVE
jgi:hypothetical protein